MHDRDQIARTVEKVLRENHELAKKIQKSGAKKHVTKLRTAVLSECRRRIETDQISEIIKQKLLLEN